MVAMATPFQIGCHVTLPHSSCSHIQLSLTQAAWFAPMHPGMSTTSPYWHGNVLLLHNRRRLVTIKLVFAIVYFVCTHNLDQPAESVIYKIRILRRTILL